MAGDAYGLEEEVYIEAWQNARSIREACDNLKDLCREARISPPPRHVLVGRVSKLRASGVRLDYLPLEVPRAVKTLEKFAQDPDGGHFLRAAPRPPDERDSRADVERLLWELGERKKSWAGC